MHLGDVRQLNARERCALMGYGSDYVDRLAHDPTRKPRLTPEQTRRSAVGNTFHKPSIVLLLVLLLRPDRLAEATYLLPTREQAQWKRLHCEGTVWDPEARSSFCKPRAAGKVLEEALGDFPCQFFAGALGLIDDAFRMLDGAV